MPQTEPGYATPKVTIKPEAVKPPEWQQFMQPLAKAFNGDDYFDDVNDLWEGREEDTLDPFGRRQREGGEEMILPSSSPEVKPTRIVLPRTSVPGDRLADRRAAEYGIDPNPSPTPGSGRIIDLAKTRLGAPYVWGAEGPSGFDCSGAVYWVFTRAGYDIPRTTAEGYQSVFAPVRRDDLQPGDVIFYNYGRKGGGRADHIEIYMGEGRQIGTSNVREDFDIDPVDWDNVVGFGRIGGAPGAAGPVEPLSKPGKPGKPGKQPPKLRKPEPVFNESSLAPLGLADSISSAFHGGN